MFKVLNRTELNISEWEKCLTLSGQSSLYAQCWYLDLVSPNWKACVWQENDRYLAVAPLPYQTKFFFKFSVQPFFTQQLGIYRIHNFSRLKEFVASVLEYLDRKFSFVVYNFNTENSTLKFPEFKGLLKKRTTYQLSLTDNYDELKKNFTQNHKRNISKASKSNIKIKDSSDLESIITIFRNHQGKKIKEIKSRHYNLLKEIFKAARQKNTAECIAGFNKEGETMAGALFVRHDHTWYYLFGAVTEEGKKTGVMHSIFNHFIQKKAASGETIDFEGSDIETIARFYSGFGAKPEFYYSYSYTRISGIYNFIQKLKRCVS